ncbi:MAG: helix-turn-helix domain-containing protein [Clostridia bacterium]|nr:helix-turn-helix domain-containing protein [Clostridia bacterium]
MNEYPDIMNSKQACKYLSIGMNSLYQLVATGRIKPFKVGRKLLFSKERLKQMVSEGA